MREFGAHGCRGHLKYDNDRDKEKEKIGKNQKKGGGGGGICTKCPTMHRIDRTKK